MKYTSFQFWFRTVRMLASVFAIGAFMPHILGQTDDEAAQTDETGSAVKMSPFQVSADAYVGYAATETSSGSRIVLKLSELPQTINVITRDLLDDMGATDPTDAMQRIAPSVSYYNGSNGVNAVIRGFRSQNWAIDGATTRYRSVINNYLFESIEVIKGPSTLLFGPFGAFGGYVNANAKYANPNMRNRIEASVGTESYYSGMVDVGGKMNDQGDLLYRMILAYHNADRAGIDYDFTQYTALAPSFAYQFSPDTLLKVRFEYIDSAQKQGRTAFDANGNLLKSFSTSGPHDITQHNSKSYGVQAILESSLSDEWSMRINFSAQSLKDDPLVTGVLIGNNLATNYNFRATQITTTQVGAYADISFAWKKENFGPNGSMSNDLIVGAEINYWNLENIIYDSFRYPASSVTPLNPANPDWSNYNFDYPFRTRFTPYNIEWLGGGFVQETLGLFHRKLLLTGGVKWNYDARTNHVQTLNAFTPAGVMVGDPSAYAIEKTPTYRYGVVFKPVENISGFVGHTESYVSGAGANRKADGSGLDPQRGANDEIGVKIDFPSIWSGVLSGGVSYFQTSVKNITRGDPNNPGFFIQDGVQENNGFEGQITYGGERLSWIIGYYKADGPTTVSAPNQPRSPTVPDETFNFWGKYRVTKSLEIGGGYRYQGDTVSNRQDGTFTDPFSTIDLFATYAIPYRQGELKYRLGVSNLADERGAYRMNRVSDVFVIDGRRVKLTASYTW